LVFLLISPAERPDVQIYLLEQLAALVGDAEVRESLTGATSLSEVIRIVNDHSHSAAR
jgi:mannitol/fructose-specific phosphotransferase system IIA component (Ntr-type)